MSLGWAYFRHKGHSFFLRNAVRRHLKEKKDLVRLRRNGEDGGTVTYSVP